MDDDDDRLYDYWYVYVVRHDDKENSINKKYKTTTKLLLWRNL